jgi:hypothetical protein
MPANHRKAVVVRSRAKPPLSADEPPATPSPIPPRFPPRRLVRRLPIEPVADTQPRQASDNPLQQRSFRSDDALVMFRDTYFRVGKGQFGFKST